MFWRHRAGKDGKDNLGRTFEEAHREHALWCLDVFRKNEPDDEEKMKYIFNNSPTYVTRPIKLKNYFSGDAAYNACVEIKMNFESFKKYYTQEEVDWVKNCFKNTTE